MPASSSLRWRTSRASRRSQLAILPLFALLLAFSLVIAAPFAASAQEAAAPGAIDLAALKKDRQKKAGRYPVSSRISRYLSAAAEEVDEGDPQEATRLL